MPNAPSVQQRLNYPSHHHVSSSVIILGAAASPPPSNVITTTSSKPDSQLRRSIFTSAVVSTLGAATCFDRPDAATAADGNLDAMLGQIKEARDQLEVVPDLIKDEKWDAGKC